jgi:outer membrane protein insertion porin family
MKMKTSFVLIPLAFWSICSAAAQTSRPAVQEVATGVHLDAVRFVGVNQLSSTEAEEFAKTLQTRTFEGPNWLNEVAERARNFWQDHGYFKAKVQPRAEPLPDLNNTHQFAVTLALDEGVQYRLSAISIRNNKAISNTAALRNLFPMADGEAFRTLAVNTGLEKMRKAYSQLGYINFTSVPDTQIDDVQQTIALTIDCAEGKPFVVRNIEFLGWRPI